MAILKTTHTFPISLGFEERQEIKPWKSKIYSLLHKNLCRRKLSSVLFSQYALPVGSFYLSEAG